MNEPLCFALMPFGKKPDPAGGADIDFDRIYAEGIQPAITDAGLQPLRADAEILGGIIHEQMFERLLLCDYAVADLTTANANVFYELGVRHAARRATTVTIFAKHNVLPFDVNFLRSIPYALGDLPALRQALARRLEELRELDEAPVDSPVIRLVGYDPPAIDRLKTDTFRERAAYSERLKGRLAAARRDRDRDAVRAIEDEIGRIDEAEAGVVVDLYLSYRALNAHEDMVRLNGLMAPELRRNVMVREQLGFALNRLERRDEAVQVLEGVLAEQGPNSETNGILGRVYKDRFSESEGAVREAWLDKAIETYVAGFRADWRDAYPGINAVTLLELKGTPEAHARRDELLPIVRFAVLQRLDEATADYWDYATVLELAVLGSNEAEAKEYLGKALIAVREDWEPQTTARNLRLIRDARGGGQPWLDEIIAGLEGAR